MTAEELLAALKKLRRRFFRPRVQNSYGTRPFSVATPEQLRTTEAALGFPLPPLLWRLYAEVGNGGFGPGYGLIGAVGGFTDALGDTIVSSYQGRVGTDRLDPTWTWPKHLVPLFSWGGAIYTCGDFGAASCALVEFDPGRVPARKPLAAAFVPHNRTLHAYLQAWITGDDVMLQ